MKNSFLILVFIIVSCSLFGQTPVLDTSYANAGYANGISNGSFVNYAQMLPDDSIIIIGEPNSNTEFYAEKFLSNGQRDTSFGNNGFILHESLLNSKEEPSGMIIQPDGKILVAGKADVNPSLFGTYDNVFVARMMPDGSLDMSFGTNGYVKVDLGTNDDEAWGIALDSLGNIYVLATLQTTNGNESRLLKFTDTGVLDSTFAVNGVLDLYFQADTQITDVITDSNDNLFLSGVVENANQVNDAVILKMDQNGMLDTTYGSNGMVTLSDGMNTNGVARSFFTPSGELLIAHAVFSAAIGRQVRVSRFLANGSFDTTFNATGQLYLDPSLNSYTTFFPYDIKLLPDGNYLILNDLIRNNNYDLYFFKITPNGVLDTSFNSSGEFWLDRSTHQDYHRDIHIESDGEVIISGMSTDNTTRFNTLTKFDGISTLSIHSTNEIVINLFPNPVNDMITIASNLPIKQVTIYNSNGHSVLETKDHSQINITNFASGLYFLQVITDNGATQMVKLIKN